MRGIWIDITLFLGENLNMHHTNHQLEQRHLEHLKSEGFTGEHLEILTQKHGVRSITISEAIDLNLYIFRDSEKITGEGILMPFCEEFYQLRLDTPVIRKNGKEAKYLTPTGSSAKAFIPEGCSVITEGFKDAMAGSLHGQVMTGAVAGVSHIRKAIPKNSGYTIIFDADGWMNHQVFAQLIHAGEWLQGKVNLLPKIEDQPKAGLCEYFQAKYNHEDYQALIACAMTPKALLYNWPKQWGNENEAGHLKRANTAARLAFLYFSDAEARAYCGMIGKLYSHLGINKTDLIAYGLNLETMNEDRPVKNTYTRTRKAIRRRFRRSLKLNELQHCIEAKGEKLDLNTVKAQMVIEHKINIQCSREELIEILSYEARENAYHPVLDYLEQVHQQHSEPPEILDDLASRYLGTDEEIHQIQLRKFLIAAVARVYDPGCKVDNVCVLQGAQGIGKSSFWRLLCGSAGFEDGVRNINDKDEMLKCHSAWMVEWAELELIFGKAATSRVKAFLTAQTDNIRPPYARTAEPMARRFVICGSTNETGFLKDSTGSRRFWVIPMSQKLNREQLLQERDRIWSAAVGLYKAGEPWYLNDQQEFVSASNASKYVEEEEWEGDILAYCIGKSEVSVKEIAIDVLKFERKELDRRTGDRIRNVLKRWGWMQRPYPVRRLYGRERTFIYTQHTQVLEKVCVFCVDRVELPLDKVLNPAQTSVPPGTNPAQKEEKDPKSSLGTDDNHVGTVEKQHECVGSNPVVDGAESVPAQWHTEKQKLSEKSAKKSGCRVLIDGEWVEAIYRSRISAYLFSPSTQKLEPGHLVDLIKEDGTLSSYKVALPELDLPSGSDQHKR